MRKERGKITKYEGFKRGIGKKAKRRKR